MPVIKVYSALGWRINYYIPSLPDIDEGDENNEESSQHNEHGESIYASLLRITAYLRKYDNRDYAKFDDILFIWLKSYQQFLTKMSAATSALSNQYESYPHRWQRFFKLRDDESVTNIFIKQLITMNGQLDESNALKFHRLYCFLNDVLGQQDTSVNLKTDKSRARCGF